MRCRVTHVEAAPDPRSARTGAPRTTGELVAAIAIVRRQGRLGSARRVFHVIRAPDGRLPPGQRVLGHAGQLAGSPVQPVVVPASARADTDPADHPRARPAAALLPHDRPAGLGRRHRCTDSGIARRRSPTSSTTPGPTRSSCCTTARSCVERYFNGMTQDDPAPADVGVEVGGRLRRGDPGRPGAARPGRSWSAPTSRRSPARATAVRRFATCWTCAPASRFSEEYTDPTPRSG